MLICEVLETIDPRTDRNTPTTGQGLPWWPQRKGDAWSGNTGRWVPSNDPHADRCQLLYFGVERIPAGALVVTESVANKWQLVVSVLPAEPPKQPANKSTAGLAKVVA